MSTAAHSLLPSSNLDVPPCSSDTGLWSFKAITMALKQALNSNQSFFLFKTPLKTSTPAISPPFPPTSSPSRLQWLHPPGPRFSQPPVGVKRAAWFSQASPFSGWQLRLFVDGEFAGSLGMTDRAFVYGQLSRVQGKKTKVPPVNFTTIIPPSGFSPLRHNPEKTFFVCLFCLLLTNLVFFFSVAKVFPLWISHTFHNWHCRVMAG